MQKMWEVYVDKVCTYKTIFGKEKECIENSGFPIYVMAESREEAIEKAKEKYNQFQIDTDSIWRFHGFYLIRNWDDWTVSKAMKMLNGKQFAEYAKQNNLDTLFKM